MAENLDRLQNILAYQFSDLTLAKQALTHRSASKDNNERLEFLGDALLDFIVGEALFSTYADASEGNLTRMRAAIVNKTALAAIAHDLELGACLVLGAGEANSGGKQRDSILADTYEALVAAIYLDGGMDPCKQFVMRSTAELIKNPQQGQRKDYKTRLQELLQSRAEELPQYRVVETHGEAHAQQFVVECEVAALPKAERGHGGSKRLAEQEAARKILGKMGESD